MSEALKAAVRDVADFPKPGILFKDITPILSDPALFQSAINAFKEIALALKIDKIAGIDARGFIFGAPLALELGVGFVPLRKKGKLPFNTQSVSYELEYGSAELEAHIDAFAPGERVLIIDDLLATGGTASAAVELINKANATLAGISFLIELEFLHGRDKLPSNLIYSIIKY
ncbi:adenine phosphoribosyltransferase [Akkermansiaceae bacterium]|nr:adenine phosphoribosyltransferase [Akkermansiaceae bacterium]